MGIFYSGAQQFVLDELSARKSKGYVDSRRQKGVYVKMASPSSGGTLDALNSTSLASRYSRSTGKPTPALQNLNIEMSGDYGSLKKGNATVKCFDKPSFEKFEQEFLIPGTEIEIKYGRVDTPGQANNGEFSGVVYDYSFKLNNQLGYDCELKFISKGSMVTEMNVNSKLESGKTFTSNYDGWNAISDVINICDVFDYDVQNDMDDQVDLDEDESFSYPSKKYPSAHVAGTDCPDAAPEPTEDGMVGGNIVYCSLGYIVNKLINDDLLTKNAEADSTTRKGRLDMKYICNNVVTIGRNYPLIFSANPMKVLITSGNKRNEKYGGEGAGMFGACKWWGKGFESSAEDPVLTGRKTAHLANILISRDVLRKCAGAGASGDEGSKTSINSFLGEIFKEIYTNSAGAWDLTATLLTEVQAREMDTKWERDSMYIVDRNWAPGSDAEKIHLNALNASSFDNSTRNVAITGKVPKDMAAAAFVGGTGTVSGKKGTVVSEILKGTVGGSVSRLEAFSEAAKLQKALLTNRELIHDNGYSEEEISSAKTNLKAYVEGGTTPTEKAEFRKDMYPLSLSATVDGINGIQFGNACQSDLVPSRYFLGSPKVCFTVIKTSHSISGNDWITDIETICRAEP